MHKRISKLLSLICSAVIVTATLPTFGSHAQTQPFWDFYTLQDYNNDHSLSTARGNWYSTSNRENFDGFSLEKCRFEGEDVRALSLTVKSESSASYASLMLKNLVNAELLGEASGMRFAVSNPSDVSLNIGITYCDTNAVYSCHKSGAYYLETKGKRYKTAPSVCWNELCEGATSEVGVVEIPSGFEGYIYIPFSSTSRAGLKSSFSRVRLFVGAKAGISQTLYLKSIDYYSTSVDFSGALSEDCGFDAFSPLPTTNATSSDYISLEASLENRDGYCGKALKTEFSVNPSAPAGYVQWRINGLWGKTFKNGAYGMRFWVKNPQNRQIEVKLQFGNGYKPCRIKSPYYVCGKDKVIKRFVTYSASNESVGCITVPAEFEGYVYLPYSLSTTAETTGHLILSPKITEKTTLYFDSFGSFDGDELFETLWYEESKQITVGSNISTDISYTKTMLEAAKGEILNVKNPNSFEVPVSVKSAPDNCLFVYDDGTVRYAPVSGEILKIPKAFCGKIYIPFNDNQSSLYSLKVQSTVSGGTFELCGIGAYNSAPYPLGDANADGKFDLLDLVRLKSFLSGKKINISENADVNGDRRNNSDDLVIVKNGLLDNIFDAKQAFEPSGIIEPLSVSVYAPSDDSLPQIIADENICDYGADSSGVSDSTDAFKKAILAVKQKGGGTVYIPQGRFLLTDTVKIPEGVTLCGQWESPESVPAGKSGSVILARGNSFLSGSVFELGTSTGIIGLTVVYPEQNISSPIKYDYAVRITGTRCYTLENFTVIGAYNGIELGTLNQSCQLYYLKNVYISALNIGITNDKTSDIGRMENVKCSPEYWCNNAVAPMSAAQKETVFEYTRLNSCGMQFYLNDWSYFYGIYIAYMKTGIYFGVSDTEKDRGFNGKFYNVNLYNCDTGIYIDKTKIGGADFTNITIKSDVISTAGIDTGTGYYGTCMFYNIETIGKIKYPIRNNSLVSKGNQGTLEFMSGSIGAYSGVVYGVTVNGGCVTLQDILFKNPSKHITANENIISLSVLGCRYNSGRNFNIPLEARGNCKIDDTPVETYTPKGVDLSGNERKPLSNTVVCVTDYGADTSLSDNTEAFTMAFNALSDTGGTVYVPAGNWRFENELTVPTGVELRGSDAVQHIQNAEHRSGTVLWCFGKSGVNGTPFITLQTGSGIRNFSVYYEQQGNTTVEFPYTVKANGKNCYVKNITLTNSYNGLDFASCDTDGFYIDSVNGCPVNTGINVGGKSDGGVLKNCHFNPNFSYVLTHNSASIDDRLYNATAYRIGDTNGLNVYGLFAYGYNNGILFESDGLKGAENTLLVNCGIDGSETSVRVRDAKSVENVNGQFVSMQSNNDKHCFITEKSFAGTFKLFNCNLWGPTTYIIKLCGGNTEYHLVNLCTGYGDYSLYMTGGNALFNSVCFHNKKIFVYGTDTSALFFGCFTRTYQTVIAPDIQNGAAVTVKNSHWA